MSTQLRAGSAVCVRVPGSSANLGPGFDSVGLALGLWDRYRAGISEQPGLVVTRGEVDNPDVPDGEDHLVVATMRRTWQELGVPQPPGLILQCANTVAQGRGLGSSAAAIVAGVGLACALVEVASADADADAAARHRAGEDPVRATGQDGAARAAVPLDLPFVNNLASLLEGHPDNASASVYGGMTLSWVDPEESSESSGPPARRLPQVHTIHLPLHPDLEAVVCVPTEQLLTAQARAVLPEQISHRAAALNSARLGLLVYAVSARLDLLVPATQEWLHQEQRRECLPAAMDLVDQLRAAGHAAVISGAGPSVLVLTSRAQVEAVTAAVPPGWKVLCPGISASGLSAERVTFNVLLRESDV